MNTVQDYQKVSNSLKMIIPSVIQMGQLMHKYTYALINYEQQTDRLNMYHS
jgi:hypothetical protein